VAHAPTGLSLRTLLPEARFVGPGDVQVRSCCGRSSDCEPNDLFVAIVESDCDGHDHVNEALRKGASAIVSERLLAIDRPQCIVDDTRRAYGRICHALAGDPSAKLNAIGVTGSLGKTVTSHLIRGILAAAEESHGIVSSLHPLVDTALSNDLEINAPSLAHFLSTMVLSGDRHAILEAPSGALAQHRFAGIELDVAVVTNIRREHLDVHGNAHNYRGAKMRIFDYLKPTGLAIVNADDPTTHFLLDQLPCPALTIGVRQSAEVTGQILERSAGEQTILIRAGNQSAPVRTAMIGAHQVYNLLTAAAVGLALGIDLPLIARGLESVASVAGRLERVVCGQDFGLFVDISRTPNQLAAALHAVRQVTTGRVICVATTAASQSAGDRVQVGRVLERGAQHCIMTSERLGLPLEYEPYHQLLDGFAQPRRGHVIPDRLAAIEQALSLAKPGDGVLISGCGEQAIATIGDEGWNITDRDVCQAWLYDQAIGSKQSAPTTFRIDDYRE
jgi:UDP-N-acetylmuramoyl-L-alanyl-D-glutamate--2,6-diaminopimelate ligase